MGQAPLKSLLRYYLTVPVNIRVNLAETARNSENLFIIGNVHALGRWQDHTLRLLRCGSTSFCATVSLPAGFPVAFKITRGTWGTEEVFRSGHARPNRIFVPKLIGANMITCQVEGWADTIVPKSPNTLTGTIKTLSPITSRFLNRDPSVKVYLPRAFTSNPSRKFPVCFFLDGQNIFDAATSFGGVEWRVDETLQLLEKENIIEPIIAVAITNGPRRSWEYTPTPFMGGGGLSEFARYLFDELTPRLREEFPVDMKSGKTGIVGSSLGGLAAFHLAWRHPDFFTRVGAVSPSFWWDHGMTLKTIAQTSEKKPLKIWLDMGEMEGFPPFLWGQSLFVKHLQQIKKKLTERGWQEGKDLKLMIDPEGSHDEASWARRFPHIARFLYGNPSNPTTRS